MSEERVPGLTVITLSYRRPDLFARLADALPQDDRIIVERICVNNGGDEGTHVAADRRGWTVMEPGRNLSFSEGCNYGVAESVSSHVLLVSNDAVVTPEALNLMWVHRPRPLLGPMLVQFDGAVNFAGGLIQAPSWAPTHLDRGADPNALDPRPRFCPWLTGACVMVERGLWDQLGGLDESFAGYGGFQDVDFCLRAVEAGVQPMVVMQARVTHNECGTRNPADDHRNGHRFYEVWQRTGRLQRALGIVE